MSAVKTGLRIAEKLADTGTPAVLTKGALYRMIGGRSQARVIARLVESGLLKKAMRGLYFNATKPYEIAQILPYVAPHGVLSLASVLGESGVLNNPTRDLMVVAPNIPSFSKDHRLLADGTRILMHHLQENLFGFGVEASRGYNRAEPERALADWLYLDLSGKSTVGRIPDDIEIERLSMTKLNRYAKKMGVPGKSIGDLLHRIDLARESTDFSPF